MRQLSRTIAAFAILTSLATATVTQTVYITKSGDKYHAAGCRYLKKSSIAIELSEAKKLGKTACSVCRP